jgi:hypothetical protein
MGVLKDGLLRLGFIHGRGLGCRHLFLGLEMNVTPMQI